MSEVTLQDFKDAAKLATENLEGITEARQREAREDSLQEVRAILAEMFPDEEIKLGGEEKEVRKIALKTAENISRMLWPERSIEVKKKKAELEVERKAFMESVMKEVEEMIEERYGAKV